MLLLHPELYNGPFIGENCAAVYISENCLARAGYREVRSTKEFRSRHAKLLEAALWRKIRELALVASRDRDVPSVARQLDYSHPVADSHTQDDEDSMSSPPRKRQSMMGSFGYGSPSTTTSVDSNSPAAGVSHEEHVDKELEDWKNLGKTWLLGTENRILEGRARLP